MTEPASQPLHYALRLAETAASTGYFTCVLETPMAFQEAMAYLRAHPMDAFMHQHLLGFISSWEPEQLAHAVAATRADDHVAHALVLEACLMKPRFDEIHRRFSTEDARRLASASPLLQIRSSCLTDQARHSRWIQCFGANILNLERITPPEAVNPGLLPAPLPDATIDKVFTELGLRPVTVSPDPDAATALHDAALGRLLKHDILAGPEMRHAASLSPIALLRQWRFSHRIRHGGLNYRFIGTQTSYGRGLHLETARAACVMEVVERWSSYATVDGSQIPGRATATDLVVARYSELDQGDTTALDPNHLALEVPYNDDALVWITAEGVRETGPRPIRVPLQCVYLFANYDETGLFSALGSTGLATGTTPAEARLSGLLEVIERDADLTRVFHWRDCFFITAADPGVQRLLDDYRHQGIHLFFQDITHDSGVPCYRCFVIAQDGTVARGTAGHLDGRRALISALTETPHPYPTDMPTQMPPQYLPVRRLEALPSFTTGRTDTDLGLLETVLTKNGYEPIYVDITTAKLEYPTVRAIVPGMAIMCDFDGLSRVSPRLFAHYRATHG